MYIIRYSVRSGVGAGAGGHTHTLVLGMCCATTRSTEQMAVRARVGQPTTVTTYHGLPPYDPDPEVRFPPTRQIFIQTRYQVYR